MSWSTNPVKIVVPPPTIGTLHHSFDAARRRWGDLPLDAYRIDTLDPAFLDTGKIGHYRGRPIRVYRRDLVGEKRAVVICDDFLNNVLDMLELQVQYLKLENGELRARLGDDSKQGG